MWVKSFGSDHCGQDGKIDYRQYLCEGRDVLSTLLSRMQWKVAEDEDIAASRDWAHRIAGNAGMYGYDQLGDTARDLDIYLNLSPAARDQDGILVRLVRLVNAVGEVTGTGAGSDKIWISGQGHLDLNKAPRAANKPVVLMADGDERLFRLVSGMLKSEADFISCNEASTVLSIAQAEKIDMAIIDEGLIDGVGYDVVRGLRADPQFAHIPVILTIHADEPDRMVRAFQAGASQVISKPYGPHAFAETLREQIDQQAPGVLLVDDDPVIQSLLRPRFEKEGLRVWTAANGQAALSLLAGHQPDVIVLDRMMPGLDGGAVLSHLKDNPEFAHIPVIILTTDTGGSDAHEWLKRGAADFIAKPFNPAEVVLRALRFLDRDETA